jgi:hypothetical protein
MNKGEVRLGEAVKVFDKLPGGVVNIPSVPAPVRKAFDPR